MGSVDLESLDPCSLVTSTVVERLLGTKVGEGVADAAAAAGRSPWCRYAFDQVRGAVTVQVEPNYYDEAEWEETLENLVADGAIRRDDLGAAGWVQAWTVTWASEDQGLRVGHASVVLPEVLLTVVVLRVPGDDEQLLADAWLVLGEVVEAWGTADIPRVTPEPTLAAASGPCDPRLAELVAHVRDRIAGWREDAVTASTLDGFGLAFMLVAISQTLEGEVAWIDRTVPPNPGFWPGLDGYAEWVRTEWAWWEEGLSGAANDRELLERSATFLHLDALEQAVDGDLAACPA